MSDKMELQKLRQLRAILSIREEATKAVLLERQRIEAEALAKTRLAQEYCEERYNAWQTMLLSGPIDLAITQAHRIEISKAEASYRDCDARANVCAEQARQGAIEYSQTRFDASSLDQKYEALRKRFRRRQEDVAAETWRIGRFQGGIK